MLAGAAFAALGALPWPAAVRAGAALGDAVRALGVRREVARANLARAFPERPPAGIEALLAEHYREIGRIAAEYGRLPALVHAREGEVVAEVEGLSGLQALRGRPALLLTGHLGNFELLGAYLARYNPVDFLVKPLANPAMESRVGRLRADAGVGQISTGAGVKQVFRALRAGHWVALLADQDARRHGVFVPFFGRLASTPEGPARLALQTRTPIVFGAAHRGADGRHHLVIDPPHLPAGDASDANVLALTAWHTARLEARVRETPEHWFWLHRRWKTPPPAGNGTEGGPNAPV
jgi:KDO2-lipid IV(A) lauroyltransferase